MRIETDRSRASQPFALPTGQSHTIQLTVNVVFFHGRDWASPDGESYRLSADGGGYDVTQPSSAARPYDETHSVLAFGGLPRSASFTLYRRLQDGEGEAVVFSGRTYEELTSAGDVTGE
ncbi:MAG: hypothetical protein K8H88_13150 [Sandaracinaceae bacterium]|nr:hypothetical protein [Sandaracinaceae bacterium]